jgi:hypothetical protein
MTPKASRIAALLVAAGCGGGSTGCGEPVYAAGATDEAWRTMVDGESSATAGDAHAPSFTTPSEGQAFASSDGAPVFAWTSPIALSGPGATRFVATAQRSRWDRLLGLFIGTAEAHLPPVTGDIYFIHIHAPGRDCSYDVLTTDLSWQVDDAGWAAMAGAAGQTLSIDITSAYLTENRITEGPYQPASPRTFSVAP